MLSTTIPRDRKLWLVILTTLLITSLALTAVAADVSELLEKAIYAEETVGDLDEAIQVYEKVLAESKGSIRAAAEAQYRIGTCYVKLGKTEDANAAFQSVIDDYPQATDWIARAKRHLPGEPELIPVPWGDGDELHFEMKLATGLGVGQQVFRIGKLEKEGRAYWVCDAWQTVVLNGQAGKSHVLVDGQTFAPVESQWKHTMLGESSAMYDKDQVAIRLMNKDEPVVLSFSEPVYDNEQAAEMFRRLPLKVGYETKVTVVSPLAATKVPITINVPKVDTIQVPAGEFECFQLKLDVGQTFWISNDEHRYIVRFEAGGVVADLTKVRPFKANESTELNASAFSATLPPDWHAYTPSQQKDDKNVNTFLVDPNAAVQSRIKSVPVELVRDERGTAREWLEWGLSDNPEHFKDYALSEQGIESVTVGGREAFQAVYEYQQGETRLKTRRINVYGDASALDIRFTMAVDAYEKTQPAIDAIVASLSVN